MDTQSTRQNISKQEIHFPNGNRAQAIISPVGTRVITLLHTLGIPHPKTVIMIVGGATQMSEQLNPDLVRLFTHGIAHLMPSTDTLIIDGGTKAGVMAFFLVLTLRSGGGKLGRESSTEKGKRSCRRPNEPLRRNSR